MSDAPQRKAKNRLTGMTIEEISLVPAGDNPDAEVVLFKADPRNPAGSDASGSVGGMTYTPTPGTGNAPSPSGDGALISGEVAEVVKGLADENEALREQNDMLLQVLVNQGLIDVDDEGYIIEKSADDDDEDFDDDDEDVELDDDDEDFDDDEDELDDEDFDNEDDDEDEDELTKSLYSNPAVAEYVASLEQELAKTRSLAEDAARVALVEQDRRLDVTFAKRAEALGGLIEADVLKQLAKTAPELYEPIEKALARAAHELELASESDAMFKQLGAPGYEDDDDPINQLLAKARTAANGNETPEQLFLKALEADPSAYDNDAALRLLGGV